MLTPSAARRSISCSLLALAATAGPSANAHTAHQPPAPAAAPPAASTPPAAAPPRPRPTVRREDLARAYIALEQALAAPPAAGQPPRDLVAINREFDRLTTMFFTGNFSGATRAVHELTRRVRGDADAPPERRFIHSLRITIDPPVTARTSDTPLTLRIQSLYPLDDAPPAPPAPAAPPTPARTFELVARVFTLRTDPTKPELARTTVTIQPGDTLDTQLTLPAPAALLRDAVGVELRVEGQAVGAAFADLSLLPEPVDQLRQSFAAKLDAAAAAHADLAPSVAVARSRLALLTDRPSALQSAQFLTPAWVLAESLRAETDALAAGRDPYREPPGTWWRSIDLAGSPWPVAIHGPRDPAATNTAPSSVFGPFVRPPNAPPGPPSAPKPLLIVLHGAGGDENMFISGYGAGRVTALADHFGFIVASPRTETLGSQPARLDLLVAELRRHYSIDPDRIYVLGHSMGAGAAAVLATARPDTIAAAACIAGGPRRAPAAGSPMAPTLVYAAELDPIIPAAPLKAAANRAAAVGLPIEYRQAAGRGHTLVVGEVLDETVQWLLKHRRNQAPATPAQLPAPPPTKAP